MGEQNFNIILIYKYSVNEHIVHGFSGIFCEEIGWTTRKNIHLCIKLHKSQLFDPYLKQPQLELIFL